MSEPPAIRPAGPADAAAIVALIRRLAAFEEPGATVALDEETVRRDAFGPGRRFQVLLAGPAGGPIVGLVVVLETYSSWAGAPALLIHDLIVEENARGQGVGRALVAAVAALALARGGRRLDVNVLDWNRPARRFYQDLGFVPLTGWLPHRLEGEALGRLAGPPPTRHPGAPD